ncbi:sirohydrochlorin chelatase [Macrococcus armenti]|uniref:sirohydrochlorin chelatase n=1 Tax=Macrococcus armenti TaxID=2875764 RepID=UPI001CC9042B|nr:sirohydrochlorin chelatase [Macrococcus armenti]UBH12488.1 sirohydrochlorin chelatase [Macrococcus armenti]UBH21645.1 sirohydrochlorin chelatase [Macrococcus armenti]
MKGIIYIAHGSKMPDKNERFRAFVQHIIEQRPEPIQHVAFLEKDDENVPIVLRRMVAEGMTELIVVPMLLFPAMHAVEDIPAQLESVLSSTNIPYVIADCFGDTAFVYEVAERIIAQYKNETILITAHGNKRFTEPDVRLTQMVNQMSVRTGQNLIPAMLYGNLSFEEMLKKMDKETPIVLMPYFLFDGHLVRKIKRLSKPFIEAGYNITFTNTLDLHFDMTRGVLQKIQEVA